MRASRSARNNTKEAKKMGTTEQEKQERTGTTIEGSKTWFDEMVAAARVVYFWHNGKKHLQIERKMRRLGWKSFHRNLLYTVSSVDGTVLREGLPDRFGWREQLPLIPPRWKRAPKAPKRDGFPIWLNKVFRNWTWDWQYQKYLFEHIARVTSGQCKRLMIFMPPRHGKSETVTFRYTAWRLLRDPGLNVIIGSYNQRLANKASRRIQRIFQDERSRTFTKSGRSHFPVAVSSGTNTRPTRAIAEWETGGGGTVRAVGVGAGIAGFGAGLVVIDDPVRNRADAESEAYREKVWDWFNDDIYTRLEPGAAIILIQTRWHDDDLAGRLLKEMQDGGEQWEVVKLPAIAEEWSADTPVRMSIAWTRTGEDEMESPHEETGLTGGTGHADEGVRVPTDPIGRRPGEALCPERYPIEELEKRRRKLGSYSFAALYQQEPVPSRGVKFKREWFRKVIDEAPKGLRWKRGYDLAVSLKTTADYTASFRCAYDKAGNLYIADGYRARIEYPEQRRYIVERMQAERNTEHGVESALHGKALIQDLRREPRNRAFAFKEVKVAGDKLTRALAWLNLAESGKLYLVRGSWIDEFVDEVSKFPHGKHDDQIDAVSVAVEMLAKKQFRSGGVLVKY
jgi:predicted phage terminase large subunit-like protein